MKIAKALAVIFLVLPLWLPAQSVVVTSPNGGESWALNSPHNITWNFQNAGAAKVDIILRIKGGAKVGVIKSQVALTAGSWPWTSVGKLEDGTVVAPGTDYIVRIRNTENTATDDSNNSFAITGAPPPATASITVTSPALNDKWNKNKNYFIIWTKAGSMPNAVKISLVDKNSASVVKEIVDGAQNSGSWPWTPPADIPFDQYRVRVLVKNTDIKDDSDTFSVAVVNLPPGVTAAKAHSLQLNPTPANSCPDCEKYEEHPQITNWGNPKDRANWVFNSVDQARPKGYPPGDPNAYAHVGYDYYTCAGTVGPVWVTFCYRSRVWVNMVGYQNLIASGRKLVSANLHLKQVSSLIAGDSHASCAVGVFVFQAPWTDFWNFQVTTPPTGTAGLEFGSTDYTKDITDIVRKWLDESWPHCGLLLTSEEVDWGQQARTCYSAFDVHMTLWFKKN
jgi:hypothetical protein